MRVLIVRNNSNPQAIDASILLATYCATQGIDYEFAYASDYAVDRALVGEVPGDALPDDPWNGVSGGDESAPAPWDFAVALGGDGTILRAARAVAPWGLPILGINFGHLGFLANSESQSVVAQFACLLAGDAVTEARTNLRVDVIWENGLQQSYFALNEVSVTRDAMGRMVDYDLAINGSRIARLRGDGIAVASATGSTGYALSAGGPVVAPGFGGMVAVPIAVHTLASRPLVTDVNDVVELDFSRNDDLHRCCVYLDGDVLAGEGAVSKVLVRRGAVPTKLVRVQDEDYYQRVSRVFFANNA